MKKISEAEIQKNIIAYVKLVYPDSLIFAVPNGGKRNIKEAVNLKRQGVVAGVSDLILIHKKKIYFIEVKSEKGMQSILQNQFQKYVESQGFNYIIVKSAGCLIDYLKKIKHEK